jgi:nitroreductase
VSQAAFRRAPHEALLRSWHLAILRFAVTHDQGDRIGVLAAANEMDRIGRPNDVGAGFSFFRRTSTSLCAAIARCGEQDTNLLRQYLASIDMPRLRQALAAALKIEYPETGSARRHSRREIDLWKGLPSRANQRNQSVRR